MKAGDIAIYKTWGTYQLIQDEDDRYYECRHIYSGQTCTADTIKEVKRVLEDLDRTHQELQSAIRKLQAYGYQVVRIVE
jgi:hypothetical protein